MKSRWHLSVLLIGCMCLTGLTSAAQQSLTAPGGATASGAVPNLIKYSSVLKDGSGAVITALSGVTFLIYKDEQGGAPLWMETQNVQPDRAGRYTVQLGSASKDGLPPDVFMTGEARWLAVQIGNQAEQARVALVAVPYAMKAADAQTLGGLPASAFMLATPSGSSVPAPGAASDSGFSSPAPAPSSSAVTTTGGTANAIPMFTTATNIQNSILTQTGTSAINVAGKLNLPVTGTATASGGKTSQAMTLSASSFNSTTKGAVAETFQWQAESAGNNTATPSGTLNLLFGASGGAPKETGLSISNTGIFNFASGQIFPGTGTITGVKTGSGSGLTGGGTSGTLNLGLQSCSTNQVLEFVSGAWACTNATSGTVTSVASGAGLTGGPITSTGTLSIATGGVTNSMLANPSVIVAAGTDLTGGGAVALGGTTTLNLDTTKVPQLGAANTFTGNQTFTGTLNISSTSTFQPFSVRSSSSFGTWLQLSNTSPGGQTWNILSAGGTNAEGAGNLGITNLHGGKIWLEGPVAASGSVDVAGLQHTLIGNTGCGDAFGGIGFGTAALADCTHYSLLGEGVHTYLNRPAGGQILFREGNNTEMVLAPGGNLGIGTTTPNFLLHVNGLMRAETGLSLGGNAVLSVDAPSFPGGQFLVQNGKVSIGGDTPMSSNPRMSFSGMFFGSLCQGQLVCGSGLGNGWGAFVPDKNIVITRITATINDPIDPSCLPGEVGVFAGDRFTQLVTASLPANSTFLDRPIIPPVAIAAGTQLFIWAILDNPSNNCNLGASAGGNIWTNVQYVMQ